MSEHGEPWDNVSTLQGDPNRRHARAIACVNALAGCNPDKLAALLVVVEKVAQMHTHRFDDCICPQCDLPRALVAFKPEPETKK